MIAKNIVETRVSRTDSVNTDAPLMTFDGSKQCKGERRFAATSIAHDTNTLSTLLTRSLVIRGIIQVRRRMLTLISRLILCKTSGRSSWYRIHRSWIWMAPLLGHSVGRAQGRFGYLSDGRLHTADATVRCAYGIVRL